MRDDLRSHREMINWVFGSCPSAQSSAAATREAVTSATGACRQRTVFVEKCTFAARNLTAAAGCDRRPTNAILYSDTSLRLADLPLDRWRLFFTRRRRHLRKGRNDIVL